MYTFMLLINYIHTSHIVYLHICMYIRVTNGVEWQEVWINNGTFPYHPLIMDHYRVQTIVYRQWNHKPFLYISVCFYYSELHRWRLMLVINNLFSFKIRRNWLDFGELNRSDADSTWCNKEVERTGPNIPRAHQACQSRERPGEGSEDLQWGRGWNANRPVGAV